MKLRLLVHVEHTHNRSRCHELALLRLTHNTNHSAYASRMRYTAAQGIVIKNYGNEVKDALQSRKHVPDYVPSALATYEGIAG